MDTFSGEGLKFDEDFHRYYLGDREVLGVTNIMKRAGEGGFISRYYTPDTRARGSAVHEAIFLDIHNDLHFASLHPEVRGFFEGWRKCRSEMNLKPVRDLCEKPDMNRLLFFAGKPDLPSMLNGRPVIIDAKTGESSTAKVQLAAYEKLDGIAEFLAASKRPGAPTRFDLRLFQNGTYKLRPHTSPNDWLKFVQCLRVIRDGREYNFT